MKRLLEVKKKIGNLSKKSENPFYKSAYLDLSDLLNAVEPLLWEQGLMLIQPIQEGKVYSSIVCVEDDSVLMDSCIDLPNITDPQKLGSCITYFRRYTLKSLLAIAEVDDDGNHASKTPVEKKPLTDASAKLNLKNRTSIEKLKEVFDLTEEQEVKYTTKLNESK